jgi:DNA (cytosine-5)-methyltransferase 1
MIMAYYNEFDPKAAAWLRQLIKDGLIANGVVDERSITDVSADDIRGFNQVHWFAGIGGWSHSLRIAGVSDEYPVWTASLPCQPFSVAGSGKGKDDERHLLPHFLELVRQCKPDTIFGEQVEGAIRHGWLCDLQTTMEAEGYAVGHCVLGAHSVGSFHQRQRLYWVACGMDDPKSQRRSIRDSKHFGKTNGEIDSSTNPGDSIAKQSSAMQITRIAGQLNPETTNTANRMGNPTSNKEHTEPTRRLHAELSNERYSGIWTRPEWLYCRDNKYRPIKPSIKPLADGIPRGMGYIGDPSEPINANATQEARGMRLKGYGNAIVPQVAAEFISAFIL